MNNLDSNEESIMETTIIGTKVWRDNEERYHRLDGPAVEWRDGTKLWYRHGLSHRVNGPACEWSNGTYRWSINGNSIVWLLPK